MMRRNFTMGCIGFAALLLATRATASQTSVWIVAKGAGYWTNNLNWSTGLCPTNGDTAILTNSSANAGSSFTVTVDYNTDINGMGLTGLTVSNAALLVTNCLLHVNPNTTNLFLLGGNCLIEVDNGGVVSNSNVNANSFKWVATNTFPVNLGANGVFYSACGSLNGSLRSSTAPSFGGTWNQGYNAGTNYWTFGASGVSNRNYILDSVLATNGARFYCGNGGNNIVLVLTNAAQLIAHSYSGQIGAGNSNVVCLYNGSLLQGWAAQNQSVTIGPGLGNGVIVNGSTFVGFKLTVGNGGTNGYLIATNGGVASFAALTTAGGVSGLTIGGTSNASNTVTITGAGSTMDMGALPLSMGVGNNTLNVLNGGTVTSSSKYNIGTTNSTCSSVVNVSGTGRTLSMGGSSYVGVNCHSNAILVSNGGAISAPIALSSAGGFTVGDYFTNTLPIPVGNHVSIDGAGSTWDMGAGGISLPYLGGNSNYISIGNGGQMKSAVNANFSHGLVNGSTNASPSIGNYCSLASGGTLQLYGGGTTNLLVNNTANGNYCTNDQGIYEFGGTSAVSVVSASPCGIYLNNGTISFINATSTMADVNCNQPGGFLTNNVNMVFNGNNTFRLNNCANRNDVGQNYTFDTSYGPTNFTRLEMVNGNTRYRHGTVTIGAGGSVLFSNTIATVSSNLDCYGTMNIIDSTVTCNSNVTLEQNFVLNESTVASTNAITVQGTLTLPVNATINIASLLTNTSVQVPIFTANAGIVGTPTGWTVNKPGYVVSKQGTQLIVRMNTGTVFLIQ